MAGKSVADEEHLKIIRQGVAAWNDWRQKNPKLRPDLSGAGSGFGKSLPMSGCVSSYSAVYLVTRPLPL